MDDLTVDDVTNDDDVQEAAPQQAALNIKKKDDSNSKGYADLLAEKTNLSKALKGERSINSNLSATNAELKAQIEDLQSKVASFEIKEVRSAAFNEALDSLGEDFEIPSSKLKGLNDLISKIEYSENIKADIANAVDLFKAPKSTESHGININSPFTANVPGSSKKTTRTEAEWMELSRTNPELFKKEYLKR